MRFYIGVSKYLGFEGVRNLLEADYDTPSARDKSYFERELGADYIEPGDYEVYDRKHYPGEAFNSELIKTLLPAPFSHPNLDVLDFSEVRTVFFLKNSAPLRPGSRGFIVIIDVFELHDDGIA